MRNRTFSNKLKIRLSPIGFDGLNFSKRITSKYNIFRKSGKLPALIFFRLFASRDLNKITNIYLSNTINNYFKHNFIVNLITFHKRLENISSPVPWLSNDKSYSNIQLQRKYLYRQAGTKRDENLIPPNPPLLKGGAVFSPFEKGGKAVIPPLWKRGGRGDFQVKHLYRRVSILQTFKNITVERDTSHSLFVSHNILHFLRIQSKQNFYKTTDSLQSALNYLTTQVANPVSGTLNNNIEYTIPVLKQSVYQMLPSMVWFLDKGGRFFKLIQTKSKAIHSTLYETFMPAGVGTKGNESLILPLIKGGISNSLYFGKAGIKGGFSDKKHGIFLNRITDRHLKTERGFYRFPISNRTSAVHRLLIADSGQQTPVPVYPEMTYFESGNRAQIKYLHDDSSQSVLNYLTTQVSNHVQRIGSSNIEYKPSIFKRGIYSMQQSSPAFIKGGISNSLYFGKAGIKGGFSDKKHGIFLNRITGRHLQTKRGFYRFPISNRTSAVNRLRSADNGPPAPGRSSVHRLRTADSGQQTPVPVYPEMTYFESGNRFQDKKKIQEESPTGLKNLLSRRSDLILRKHVAQNADIFSENKETFSTKREDTISTKIIDNSIRGSSKERPTHEINLIADKVYKIIEKKIVIERDRRGLF